MLGVYGIGRTCILYLEGEKFLKQRFEPVIRASIPEPTYPPCKYVAGAETEERCWGLGQESDWKRITNGSTVQRVQAPLLSMLPLRRIKGS